MEGQRPAGMEVEAAPAAGLAPARAGAGGAAEGGAPAAGPAHRPGQDLEKLPSTQDLSLHLPLSPVVVSSTSVQDLLAGRAASGDAPSPRRAAAAAAAPGAAASAAGSSPAPAAPSGPVDGGSGAASASAAANAAAAQPPPAAAPAPLPRPASSSGAPAVSRQSSLFLQPVRRSGVVVYGFGRNDCGQLGQVGTGEGDEAFFSVLGSWITGG